MILTGKMYRALEPWMLSLRREAAVRTTNPFKLARNSCTLLVALAGCGGTVQGRGEATLVGEPPKAAPRPSEVRDATPPVVQDASPPVVQGAAAPAESTILKGAVAVRIAVGFGHSRTGLKRSNYVLIPRWLVLPNQSKTFPPSRDNATPLPVAMARPI